MFGRRALLSKITAVSVAGSTVGVTAESGRSAEAKATSNQDEYPFRRDDDRVQLVEADPDYGFNFPYRLATPERFRSEPIPLMVEMNNAQEGQTIDTLTDRVWDQITRFELQGPWLSEEVGIPHLIPVVPLPDGDPVDRTHRTINLNRNAMLLDGTELDRMDLQVRRMADHAREEVLSDHQMHEKLLLYGNSSGGRFGVRFSTVHPDEVLAVAAGGINGFVTLPLAALGDRTLNYPVGVGDLESIVGTPYDSTAHDRVNKFYFQGGEDPKNPLPMEDGLLEAEWNDETIYETARAVYGPYTVTERFPRCQLAYRKAGIDGQFRIYPEMTHDPTPASQDIRDFFEKSIAGADVSTFGQRLELPFDREIVVGTPEPEISEPVQYSVSGDYPPPEGLVSYGWQFGDGGTGTGLDVSHVYDDPDTVDVRLTMETSHGQQATETTQVKIQGTVTITATSVSQKKVPAGDPVSVTVELTNQAKNPETVELVLRDERDPLHRLESRDVTLESGVTKEVALAHTFTETGEYPLVVNDQAIGTVTVVEASSIPTPPDSTVPGLGVPSALAGLGSAISYVILRDETGE